MIRATVYGEARPEGALAIGKRRDGRRYLHHRDGASLTPGGRRSRKSPGDAQLMLPLYE